MNLPIDPTESSWGWLEEFSRNNLRANLGGSRRRSRCDNGNLQSQQVVAAAREGRQRQPQQTLVRLIADMMLRGRELEAAPLERRPPVDGRQLPAGCPASSNRWRIPRDCFKFNAWPGDKWNNSDPFAEWADKQPVESRPPLLSAQRRPGGGGGGEKNGEIMKWPSAAK